MSLEEVVKTALENPELTALGAGTLYTAGTYLMGRMHTYETTREAEQILEEGYSSGLDLLRGLYDKGKMDSARADIESKRKDPYPEIDDPEALGLEPGEDIESYWEDVRSERQPLRGD